MPFARGASHSLTTDCDRLDVIPEAVSALAETPFRCRLTIFDRDGLDARIPGPDPGSGPDRRRLEATVEEFFRIAAIAPLMVEARRDCLSAVSGVQTLTLMLYQLYVEANQPLPPMGIKQWSAKLTASQRELLTALPTAEATPESLRPALRAVVDAMRTSGRDAAEAAGASWPEELDATVTAFLERTLR